MSVERCEPNFQTRSHFTACAADAPFLFQDPTFQFVVMCPYSPSVCPCLSGPRGNFSVLHDFDTLKWLGILYTGQVFTECPLIWVCLKVSHDESKIMHSWQEYHQQKFCKCSVDFGEVRHRNDGQFFFIKSFTMTYTSCSKFINPITCFLHFPQKKKNHAFSCSGCHSFLGWCRL